MCPLEQCQGAIGNCEFCSQKSDCILLKILHELTLLRESAEAEKISI